MNPVVFFVPGNPQPAGSKRAFVLRGGIHAGRAIITDANSKAKPWQQEIKGVAIDVFEQQMGGVLLTEPLEVSFEFRVHRPGCHFGSGKNALNVKESAPRWPAKKPDVLKLARCVEDALTKVIWVDDCQIVIEHLTKRYVPNDAQTGVLVTIKSAEEEAPKEHVGLQGEIKVGERFIWEPNKPHAYCHVEVVAIRFSGSDEQVQTKTDKGGLHWNDMTRFREACIRA